MPRLLAWFLRHKHLSESHVWNTNLISTLKTGHPECIIWPKRTMEALVLLLLYQNLFTLAGNVSRLALRIPLKVEWRSRRHLAHSSFPLPFTWGRTTCPDRVLKFEKKSVIELICGKYKGIFNELPYEKSYPTALYFTILELHICPHSVFAPKSWSLHIFPSVVQELRSNMVTNYRPEIRGQP